MLIQILNLYNEMFGSISTICNYHEKDQLNGRIRNDLNDTKCPLSMCHIHIGSKNINVKAFVQFHAGLRFEFAFIGVSETWLTDNNYDLSNLSGYTFIEQQKLEKRVLE